MDSIKRITKWQLAAFAVFLILVFTNPTIKDYRELIETDGHPGRYYFLMFSLFYDDGSYWIGIFRNIFGLYTGLILLAVMAAIAILWIMWIVIKRYQTIRIVGIILLATGLFVGGVVVGRSFISNSTVSYIQSPVKETHSITVTAAMPVDRIETLEDIDSFVNGEVVRDAFGVPVRNNKKGDLRDLGFKPIQKPPAKK